MTPVSEVEELAVAIGRALPELGVGDQRIAICLYRALAAGRSVTPAQVAAASGTAEADVAAALRSWPAVFFDGYGSIVGFWGLTVMEMPPHKMLVAGARLWAWCAWDTLFIPRLLDATVEVRSASPGGETIELRVAPDRVESVTRKDVVISFLRPDRPFDGDVITSFCHFVHFFPSPAEGERWVVRHPGTFLLSLAEAFDLARISNRRFAAALGTGERL